MKKLFLQILFFIILAAGTFLVTNSLLLSSKENTQKTPTTEDPALFSLRYWLDELKICRKNGFRNCDAAATQFVLNIHQTQIPNISINHEGKFTLFLFENTLIYLKKNCKQADIQTDMFPINYYPKDVNLVSAARRKRKLPFFNSVEYFKKSGYKSNGTCLLVANLKVKKEQIKKIITGQFIPKKSWEWNITWKIPPKIKTK